MKKKLLSILLTIAIVSALVVATPITTSAAGYWENNTATVTPAGDTYNIYNAEELAWVMMQVNHDGKDFSGKKIVLQNDIDLSGKNWMPIGCYGGGSFLGYTGTRFRGTFDGQGYKITGMEVKNGSGFEDGGFVHFVDNTAVGLFGYTDNAVIMNVNVVGEIDSTVGFYKFLLQIIETNSPCTLYAGGVVGYGYNSSIKNCSADVDINITAASGAVTSGLSHTIFAGGFAGILNGCNVRNCYSITDTLKATEGVKCKIGVVTQIGGFVGEMLGNTSSNVTILSKTQNCYAKLNHLELESSPTINWTNNIGMFTSLTVDTTIDWCYTALYPDSSKPFYNIFCNLSNKNSVYTACSFFDEKTNLSPIRYYNVQKELVNGDGLRIFGASGLRSALNSWTQLMTEEEPGELYYYWLNNDVPVIFTKDAPQVDIPLVTVEPPKIIEVTVTQDDVALVEISRDTPWLLTTFEHLLTFNTTLPKGTRISFTDTAVGNTVWSYTVAEDNRISQLRLTDFYSREDPNKQYEGVIGGKIEDGKLRFSVYFPQNTKISDYIMTLQIVYTSLGYGTIYKVGETSFTIHVVEKTKPTLSPTTAAYETSNPQDISVSYSSGDYGFEKITFDGKQLDFSNYTMDMTNVTLKKEFLKTLSVGEHKMVMEYKGNDVINPVLTITVSDTRVAPTISHNTFWFVKNTPKDITFTKTDGNYTLQNINTTNSSILTPGVDYTIVGDTVTISQSFLSTMSDGGHIFRLQYDSGMLKAFTVTIKTLIPAEKPDASFDASERILRNTQSGQFYRIDGGSWTAIAATSVDLSGIVTGACSIELYRPGDNTATIDSEYQTISVTKSGTPTPVGVATTVYGKNDGKITGVDSTMEYQKQDAGAWTSVNGAEVNNLSAGTYFVRVKANGSTFASDQAEVTISEGNKLALHLPKAPVGYSIVSSDDTMVSYNGSFAFSVIISDGYSKTENFAVLVNGKELLHDDNGTYIIENITKDNTLTVEGVADITAPTAQIKLGADEWTQFLNTVTLGLFFKQTQTLSLSVSDKGSKIKSVEYLLSDTVFQNQAEVTGTWKTPIELNGAYSIFLEQNSKQYVYVRVKDNAENTLIINSEGIIIYTDSTLPVTTAEFNPDKPENIEIPVSFNGNTLNKIAIGNTALAKDTDYTVSTDKIVIKAKSLADNLTGDSLTLTFSYNPMGESFTGTQNAPMEAIFTVTKHIHTPEADDGDCTSEVHCSVCGFVTAAAKAHDFSGDWRTDDSGHWHACQNVACTVADKKAAHTPEADDGDCTSEVHCSVCGFVTAAAKAHDFSGKWLFDADNQWHSCQNKGCTVADRKEAHSFIWVTDKAATESENGSKHEECSVCGYKKAAVEIPSTDDVSAPPTNDQNHILLWVLLMFVSGSVLTTLIITKKRKVK